MRIDLPPFTLIGATTRSGLLTTPCSRTLRHPVRLNFYPAEAPGWWSRARRVLGTDLADSAAAEIARRSRGTPRVAGRLLRRVRDFAAAAGPGDHMPSPTKR